MSDAMDKTVVVRVDVLKPHPKYKKTMRRSIRLHAHDQENASKVDEKDRAKGMPESDKPATPATEEPKK